MPDLAFLDRPWVAVFTPEARRAGGRRLFLNRWPSLPDQLRGMRQSMDPDQARSCLETPPSKASPIWWWREIDAPWNPWVACWQNRSSSNFLWALAINPVGYWLLMAIVAQLLATACGSSEGWRSALRM